jgi:uncharacterized repeat protein (TIGR03837 family)
MHWDLHCRVIDNYGDVGVAWRLAADLAARGEAVRLWLDDARALAWMAPAGAPGVEVLPWGEARAPGDVVIELFGCALPAETIAAIAARRPAPVWLNLEYLSAEDYVERSHGLPSPQPGGLAKWFFYPGFTPRTGGLLREPGLLETRARFDRDGWLAARGIAAHAGERLVSVFAYAHAPLPALLDRLLAAGPVRLLLTAGMGEVAPRPGLAVHRLPWLAQTEFDRLLWACDLNLVRGEDSLVRALWAGVPWLWQIYPQHDGVHAGKLDALLARLAVAPGIAAWQRAWNGLGAWHGSPDAAGWRAAAAAWRDTLAVQADLTARLLGFVAAKR